MTDRELLELAAKAAGIKHKYNEFWGSFYLEVKDKYKGVYWDSDSKWNPLEDDGDALRLAIKLGMEIHTYVVPLYIEDAPYVEVVVYWWSERTKERVVIKVKEDFDSDQYSATRRAIVRAAAEIGKGLSQPITNDVPEDNPS